MVASLTVRTATGMPRRCAVRSSASSRALAIPRRRYEGETVTALIAQAATLRSTGTASRVGQELTVPTGVRSEEHTSELQSRENLVCRLLLEKKNTVN